MTPEPTTRGTRMAFLVAHLLALLGGLAYGWGQFSDVAARQAAVAQSRHMAAELAARLSTGDPRPGTAPPQPIDPFLPGASATLAGANLQDQVVSAIRKAGGTVTSSQVDTTGSGTPPAAAGAMPADVKITVSCEMQNAALQGLLYALESNVPALFIDQLTVESATPASGNPASASAGLKVSLVISAYWTGEGKS